jgi:hypothetical protein
MGPILMIALGTVLIAFGGVVATKGWHDRNFAAQRKRLVRSVAFEVALDMDMLENPVFDEPNEQNLTKFTLLPRMQTSTLAAAIGSGVLFEERDILLLANITELYELLNHFNRLLALTEDEMAKSQPSRIAEWRKKMRDGKVRTNLRGKFDQTCELLAKDYGIELPKRGLLGADPNFPRK